MDPNDRAVAYGTAIIPPWLAHRYRQDPVFHHLVEVLLQLLQGKPEIGAADIREASLVADELRREMLIQERMRNPIDPITKATRMSAIVSGRRLDRLPDRDEDRYRVLTVQTASNTNPRGGTDDD